MKITAVTSLYKPHIGGVETMVGEMAKSLSGYGHEVDILAKQWPSYLPNSEIIDGVMVNRLPAGIEGNDILNIANYLKANPRIFQDTDLIHLIGMRRPLPLHLSVIANAREIPIVGSVVGSEVPNPGAPSDDHIWREGSNYMVDAYTNIPVITAVSSAIRDYAVKTIPSLEGKVDVLPAGVDTKKYETMSPIKPDGTERFILSLRRLEYSKGIDVLIQAYILLIENHLIDEDIALVIAGEGPEKENLKQLAKYVKNIKFIGNLSIEDSIGMLKTAELTVVPSRSEGGGLVNTEANAVGCPLVASDLPGIKEYTSHDSAVLVEPQNIESLALAIREVLSNESLRNRIVRVGKTEAKKLDWQSIIERYISTYEHALNQPPKEYFATTKMGKCVLNILGGKN